MIILCSFVVPISFLFQFIENEVWLTLVPQNFNKRVFQRTNLVIEMVKMPARWVGGCQKSTPIVRKTPPTVFNISIGHKSEMCILLEFWLLISYEKDTSCWTSSYCTQGTPFLWVDSVYHIRVDKWIMDAIHIKENPVFYHIDSFLLVLGYFGKLV